MMKAQTLFLRIMLAGVLLFAVAGCTDGASDEEVTGQETTSESTDAEEAPAVSEGDGGWMDGIPATVPQFSYGTFDKEESSTFQAGPQLLYNLYYDEVAEADFEAYLASLEAAGFTVVPEDVTDGASANGEFLQDDVKVLGYVISWQSNGHVDYTITVLPGAES